MSRAARPRRVARLSNWLEAIGSLIILIWAVLALIGGHWILGIVLAVIGLVIGWVTVREFTGHGLGSPANDARD